MPSRTAIGICSVVLAACSSHPPEPGAARAIRVVGTNDVQCIMQMQSVMQRPGGSTASLGATAFTVEDRLSIVPSDTVSDAAGHPASGRLLGRPDHFQLTLNRGVCTLVREADAQATPLAACTCEAIP